MLKNQLTHINYMPVETESGRVELNGANVDQRVVLSVAGKCRTGFNGEITEDREG